MQQRQQPPPVPHGEIRLKRVTASVTLRWAADAPDVCDAGETTLSCSRASSTPVAPAHTEARDVFLVSEATVRVPISLCLLPPPDNSSAVETRSPHTAVAPLRCLVWSTALHAVQKVQLEVDDTLDEGSSPDAAGTRLLTLPASTYAVQSCAGCVTDAEEPCAWTSSPTSTDRENSLMSKDDGDDVVGRAAEGTPAEKAKEGELTVSLQMPEASCSASVLDAVAVPPSSSLSATAAVVTPPPLLPSALSTQGASGQCDPLVLTLDSPEDEQNSLATDDDGNVNGADAAGRAHAGSSPASIGVKREREGSLSDERSAPARCGTSPGFPLSRAVKVEPDAFTDAPRSPLPPPSAPRRRLFLGCATVVPGKASITDDNDAPKHEATDDPTTFVKAENQGEGEEACSGAKGSRVLSLRGAAALTTVEVECGAEESRASAAPPPRRLKLFAPLVPDTAVKAEPVEAKDASHHTGGVSPPPDATSLTRDDGGNDVGGAQDGAMLTPYLVSVTGLCASSAGGVPEDDPWQAFFAHSDWAQRVRAVVLVFSPPDALPTTAARRDWVTQSLARMLYRPRQHALELTRAELLRGPTERHLHAIGHPRLSAAVCPHVSALVAVRSNSADETNSTPTTLPETTPVSPALYVASAHSVMSTAELAIVVRGSPVEPVLVEGIHFDEATPLALTETEAPAADSQPSDTATPLPPQGLSTIRSTTHTRLALLEGLPVTASRLRIVLRLHTTVSRDEGSEGSAENTSAVSAAPLAPLGAGTHTGQTEALKRRPGDVPPLSYQHTLSYQGLNWLVWEYADGDTVEYASPHPSTLTSTTTAPEVLAPWRYVSWDLCVEPLEAIGRYMAPLHFLLLHIEAWWATQSDVRPVHRQRAPLTAHQNTHSPQGVLDGGHPWEGCLMAVCGSTNWVLDTQRGVHACANGITVAAALIDAMTPLWARGQPRQPRPALPPSALAAVAALASGFIEHRLHRHYVETHDLATPASLVSQWQAVALAYGYTYTSQHLPHAWQRHDSYISETMPLNAPLRPGESIAHRDGTATTLAPAANSAALTATHADQRRLVQWWRAVSRDTDGVSIRSRRELPSPLRQVLASSPWRIPFVYDYFARTAAALLQLDKMHSPMCAHAVCLHAVTDVDLNPRVSTVSLQLSAEVVPLGTTRTPRDPTTGLHSLHAPHPEPDLTVPLVALLLAVERRVDRVCSLESVSTALAAELQAGARAHNGSVSGSFRVCLYEMIPVTWPLSRTDASSTSPQLAHTTATMTHFDGQGQHHTRRLVFANPCATDAEDDAAAALESRPLAGKGKPTVVTKPRGDDTEGGAEGLELGEELSADGDDDATSAHEAASTAGTDCLWSPVALVPIVSLPATTLREHASMVVVTPTLADAIESALLTQSTRLVESLVPRVTETPPRSSSSSGAGRRTRSRASRKAVCAHAAAVAAVNAETQAAVDRLAGPLATLWGRLLVTYLTGHALLHERHGPLLRHLRETIEARADCLPLNATLRCHDEDDTGGVRDALTPALRLLHPDVAGAFTHVLRSITVDQQAGRTSAGGVAPLRDTLHDLFHYATSLQHAVAHAAGEVLRLSDLDTLCRETADALALTNLSLARWRARFQIKAELKNAPRARHPLDVDVSPLEALANGSPQAPHVGEEGNLPMAETWARVLRACVLLP